MCAFCFSLFFIFCQNTAKNFFFQSFFSGKTAKKHPKKHIFTCSMKKYCAYYQSLKIKMQLFLFYYVINRKLIYFCLEEQQQKLTLKK